MGKWQGDYPPRCNQLYVYSWILWCKSNGHLTFSRATLCVRFLCSKHFLVSIQCFQIPQSTPNGAIIHECKVKSFIIKKKTIKALQLSKALRLNIKLYNRPNNLKQMT